MRDLILLTVVVVSLAACQADPAPSTGAMPPSAPAERVPAEPVPAQATPSEVPPEAKATTKPTPEPVAEVTPPASPTAAAPADPAAAAASPPGEQAAEPAPAQVAPAQVAPAQVAPAQVSNAELEERLLALASCELIAQGIDPECEALKRYSEGRSSDKMLAAFNSGARDVGRRHLTSPSAAVRLQAVQLLGSLHKASQQAQQPLIDAAAAETDMFVKIQMLRRLGTSIGRIPAVLELMMASSRHEAPEIRMEAAMWLLSGWARNTEGTLERALQLAGEDPVRRVRRLACRKLGERSDERALPLLRRLTAGPGSDPELYAACLMGLIAMWSYPTAHSPPSRKAFDLTMRRLRAVPRTTETPPWNALSGLQWTKDETFRQRAPWFKPAALERLLVQIANDRGAGWEARNISIEILVELGAAPEVLTGLLEAYKGVSRHDGDDRFVLAKLEHVTGQVPAEGALPLPQFEIPDAPTPSAP